MVSSPIKVLSLSAQGCFLQVLPGFAAGIAGSQLGWFSRLSTVLPAVVRHLHAQARFSQKSWSHFLKDLSLIFLLMLATNTACTLFRIKMYLPYCSLHIYVNLGNSNKRPIGTYPYLMDKPRQQVIWLLYGIVSPAGISTVCPDRDQRLEHVQRHLDLRLGCGQHGQSGLGRGCLQSSTKVDLLATD